MSAKDKFIVRGVGQVRSFEIKAGQEMIKVHFYAKSPNEIAQYFGAQSRFDPTPEGDTARQDHRAEFIANSMVDDDGKTPMFTLAEAKLMPITMRPLFVNGIVEGSSTIEGVKKS